MKRKTLLTIFGVICAVLMVGYVLLDNRRLSSKNQAFVEAKWQRIVDEIATLQDHPWAGTYYEGDRLGTNITLTLAPENGFTITWYGCLGLYDQNHGTVDWDSEIVKLSFAWRTSDSGIGSYASEYRPIRWGERIYLIPVDGIIGFCNAINSRSEPITGELGIGWSFFLRLGDEYKKATGKPELPEQYMAYLLDEPVDATIVSIRGIRDGDYGAKIATIIVDKGKEHGLLPGMELRLINPPDHGLHFRSIKLTKVEELQSEGEHRFHDLALEIGWQLSTVPHWRRDDFSD